ncbi:MAG: helix-turn-helix domain-containing protein [Hyphomonadaceae bacterium]|nr:helix-turn-helix domain-containing protein [Hyphomonadaceae bacterium]
MGMLMRLGVPSAVLLVFALQALILAAALALSGGNRRANFYLCALMIVCAGMAAPFIIGYAGGYDTWPWLSFAPFAWPLALGPLVYGHVVALAQDRDISRWHFAPALAYGLYQTIMFVQPLGAKNWVDVHIQEPFLTPLLSLAVPASLLVYAVLGWRVAQGFETWLRNRRRRETPARRLRVPLAVLSILALTRLGFAVFDLSIRALNYFDLFSFYLGLGILSTWLGVDAWRNAARTSPSLAPAPDRDWAKQGRLWIETIEKDGFWRDAEASLDSIARALGTNRTSLSRALNAAGEGLSDVLNRLRTSEASRRLLTEPDADVLFIALESGFGSKAAFNRAFKARFGVTPSQYRQFEGRKA